jgi:phenylpropionate dioxygenase-like ring-hydroxylating dioxygenase large terminal subunit
MENLIKFIYKRKLNIKIKMIFFYLLGFFFVYSCNAFYFPNMLPQFNYQIAKVQDLKDKPIKIVIDNNDLALFKDQKTGEIKLVEDRCQHRGASLATGWLGDENTGGLICPYHGINFHRGVKPDLSANLKIINDIIYFSPSLDSIEPFYPPEEYDKTFRVIDGSCKVKTNINIFAENVIDCTHIRTVHLFGFNDEGNYPINLKYERLSDFGYRQNFDYKTGKFSLSYQLQKLKKKEGMLKVQNEYHLPSNVLSRVKVDDKDVKTVFVRAFPINSKETIIYWKIYRNFLVFDFEPLSILGDMLFRALFEYTLSEDIGLLKNVYLDQDHKKQFHTKYDKIQKEFRSDYIKNKIIGAVKENLKGSCKCSDIPKNCDQKDLSTEDSNPFIYELF